MAHNLDALRLELRRPEVLELVEMYDLFANKCTRQEEKYDYYRRNGINHTWADLEAAYAMLVADYPNGAAWFLWDIWRKSGIAAWR